MARDLLHIGVGRDDLRSLVGGPCQPSNGVGWWMFVVHFFLLPVGGGGKELH